jgi:hypothetical protein
VYDKLFLGYRGLQNSYNWPRAAINKQTEFFNIQGLEHQAHLAFGKDALLNRKMVLYSAEI